MCVTILANPDVKPERLVELLEDLACHFEYLIVSDWRDVHFIHFNQRDNSSFEASYSGRAFGPNAELRWRRSGDKSHFICRWLSENCPAPPGDDWKPLPDDEPKDFTLDYANYLLWGEPLWKVGDSDDSEWQEEDGEKIWYQARIPKKLKYPINGNLGCQWTNSDDKKPLVLHVREYKRKGQTLFERFICLKRYKSTQ